MHEVFKDIKRRFDAAGSRIIEDHTSDPLPEREGQAEPQEEAPGETDQEGIARGLPRPRLDDAEILPPVVVDIEPAPEIPDTPVPAQPPATLGPEQATRERQRTESTNEPEVEAAPHPSNVMPGDVIELKASFGRKDSEQAWQQPMPMPTRSSTSSAFGPQRPRLEDRTVEPYRRLPLDDNIINQYLTEAELFVGELESKAVPPEASEREAARHRDHWEVIAEKGVLRRHHVKWRMHTFSPWETPKVPVELKALSSSRKTVMVFKDGDHDVVEDDWRSQKPKSKQRAKWKGYTDFYAPAAVLNAVDDGIYGNHLGYRGEASYSFLEVDNDIFLGKKMGSDEVSERDILPHEWPSWLL